MGSSPISCTNNNLNNNKTMNNWVNVCANCKHQDWFKSHCDINNCYAPDLKEACNKFKDRNP